MNARFYIAGTLALCATGPFAAQPSQEDEGPKFIVRVARDFLAQMTEVEFSRQKPIRKWVMGAWVVGTADIHGKFKLQVETSEPIEGFELLVKGQVANRSNATAKMVIVHTNGQASFTARRQVSFTGKEFIGQPVAVEVDYRSRLEGVSARGNGPFSGITRSLAYPSVVKKMPTADRIVERDLHEGIERSVEEESDEMLTPLNRVTGVASTFVKLLQKTPAAAGTTELQLAATEEHLLAAITPKNSMLPELPELGEKDRAPVELWLRRSKTSDGVDPLPGLRLYWRTLKPLLQKRLSRTVPELADLLDNVQITELSDWRVVRFSLEAVKK